MQPTSGALLTDSNMILSDLKGYRISRVLRPITGAFLDMNLMVGVAGLVPIIEIPLFPQNLNPGP